MNLFFEILSILLFIIGAWVGLKKIKASKLSQWILVFLDIGVLFVSIIKLGLLGIWIVIFANVLAFIAYSVWIAMRKESILVSASIQGDIDRADIENLYSELPKLHRVFKSIHPLERAELLLYLCIRKRGIEEIKSISVPIALIYVVQKVNLKVLVDKFDQLLRLWGKTADDAMDVADKLTKGSQMSASSFEEMLDAMIAFQNLSPP